MVTSSVFECCLRAHGDRACRRLRAPTSSGSRDDRERGSTHVESRLTISVAVAPSVSQNWAALILFSDPIKNRQKSSPIA